VVPRLRLQYLWTVLKTYWLAYAIVAAVSVPFLLSGQWIYVVVWVALLAAITAALVFVLARDQVTWEDLLRGVQDGAVLPAAGEVYGCVVAGPYTTYVLKITELSSPLCVVRLRPIGGVDRRLLEVEGARRDDVVSLVRDGVVRLIGDPGLVRRVQRGYFQGRRARPDRRINVRSLRP
jgi:hypothetical protein